MTLDDGAGALRRRRRRHVATTCARCSTTRPTRPTSPTASARRARRARVVGKHCESGDVLIRETALPDPRPGDVLVTPGHRRLRVRDGQQLQRRPARRRSSSAPAASARVVVRRETYEDLHGQRRLGSACSATARSARRSRRCSPSARTRSRAITGLRPELTGVLTRSRGDFDEILERLRPDRRADRRHRPGARLRAAGDARRQARRLGQQAAARPARRGAVGDCAREHERPAALRGRGGRRRAGHPRAAGVARRRPRGAHPRDRQRHDELHPHRDGARRASPTSDALGRRAGARLRRGRPDRRRHRPRRRGQDGDPRPAGVLHPGAPRPGDLRGHRAHHRRRHRLRARPRPRA